MSWAVRSLLQLPVVRLLHRRQLLFPAVLVLIAAGVLFQGTLERSAAPPSSAAARVPGTVPAEPARVVVRADLDKTPLTYFADYWAQLAERTGPHLVAIGSARTPAIAVGTRLVLTTAAPALEVLAAERRARLTDDPDAPGGALELGRFRLRGWDPDIGLALFDVSGAELTPFTLTDPRAMPSGSYVGAVTLTAEGEPAVAPGYFVAVEEEHDGAAGDLVVSVNMPDAPGLAAVVNLDGALLGVAHATPAGPRVSSSLRMLRLIERLQQEEVCRGVEVADLAGAVREQFVIERGVLIEYVHAGAFHPEPSLRGGDILLEWNAEDVTSAEQFRQLYDAGTPGELVRYRVLRNRRRLAGGTLLPDADCKPAGRGPRALRVVGHGVRVATARHGRRARRRRLGGDGGAARRPGGAGRRRGAGPAAVGRPPHDGCRGRPAGAGGGVGGHGADAPVAAARGAEEARGRTTGRTAAPGRRSRDGALTRHGRRE